jgi:predicted nucleotidyltransferase
VRLAQAPIDALVAGLQEIFGDDLIGVYLHGSAALGCYGPHSDVDVVAAISRDSSTDEQRRLADLCLAVSRPTWDDSHCLLELDVVVAPDVRPWRYPPPIDFHFSESFREGFERGEPKPWRVAESADLAASLTVLHAAGVVLTGARVQEVFPPVPLPDYRAAIVSDLPWCLERRDDRRLYVVLGLPRIWAGLTTETVHSKATAAEWALPRLTSELRPVLEHGLAAYRGEAEESWADLPVDDYIDFVIERIPR